MTTQTLKFLGRGSAFNVEEGNTSAFLKTKGDFLLIDCGEDVFAKLIKLKVLEDVRTVTIIITHMHSDHVGSLSSLLFYCRYVLKIVPTVFVGEKLKQTLIDYLTIQGNLHTDYYVNASMVSEYNPNIRKMLFGREVMSLEFFEVDHIVSNPNFISYGFVITFYKEQKSILYSGDCVRLPDDIMEIFNNRWYDEVYLDTCGNKDVDCHHILGSIDFPEDKRDRIFAMHLDNIPHYEIQKYGMNVVSLYRGE